MRFPRSVSVIFLAGLAGCATITPEEQRARDEQECLGYGFRPKTDAYAECLQRIELDRRAEQRYQMMRLDSWDEPVVVYQPVIVRRDD